MSNALYKHTFLASTFAILTLVGAVYLTASAVNTHPFLVSSESDYRGHNNYECSARPDQPSSPPQPSSSQSSSSSRLSPEVSPNVGISPNISPNVSPNIGSTGARDAGQNEWSGNWRVRPQQP
jgi:hypothetical protein